MKIIGISGKARHGKDYLANELQRIIPGSQRYSLANALKCYCRVAGLMGVKDGKVLQIVGTDLYRKKDFDFWVKMLDYQLQEEQPSVAIIPDVRFKNEVEWLKSKEAVVLRIERYNPDGTMYYTDDRPKDHPSEVGLDDYYFNNKLKAVSGDLENIKDYAYMIKDIYGLYE